MSLTDERIQEIAEQQAIAFNSGSYRLLPQFIESAIRQALAEAQEWRDMESAPRDGTEIIVLFKGIGPKSVAWLDPHGDDSYSIWCVDDNKHGPYPLRGWIEGDELGWQPLPRTEP